ncbi:phosphatase [Halothermothrix orenii]|uniref:Biotin (Acetyl-CoA carboxylase) synthetase n=1 Tax=Halothermothrix orenii (strain H 168 / OCM 544 / DSM 9562) TaxID=373903 RepID=B8CZF1_HALOH|nr:phosphatase [Halothermothrix orenii]ACL70670.1 biotin (acetyl-CoA carboxylase) synthetase [Halothermothrix orenii H 168]
MKIEADLHTHTVASGHAYSSVGEIAKSARDKGLKLIAITDHGPGMPGGPHEYYFGNLKAIPDVVHGVRILKGIEANILNTGELDLSVERLEELDFVAAGIHGDVDYNKKSRLEHTEVTITAIKNPYVDMITHPANLYFPLDLEAVVQAAAEYQVILEVNASSLEEPRLGKRGSYELTIQLCRLAKKYGAPLSMNSDAHFFTQVGNIKSLKPVIEQAELTEEDILNTDARKVESFILNRK